MLPCDATLRRYTTMLHYHGTLPHYATTLRNDATLPLDYAALRRYTITERYHATLRRYTTTLPRCATTLHDHATTLCYDATRPCYHAVLRRYTTTLQRYATMLRYHGTLPRYATTLQYHATALCCDATHPRNAKKDEDPCPLPRPQDPPTGGGGEQDFFGLYRLTETAAEPGSRARPVNVLPTLSRLFSGYQRQPNTKPTLPPGLGSRPTTLCSGSGSGAVVQRLNSHSQV